MEYNNISIGSYRNYTNYYTNFNRVDEYSVCLNKASEFNNCVAIGLNAISSGKRSIAIGYQANATEDDQIMLGDVNIREMRNEIEDLKAIVKEQQEMLIALWHHPGMPGYQEAKDQYENYISDGTF
jgi:YadA head domain repeat (2 copies)